MSKKNRIGIISLGWLGESLADFLHVRGFSVWGTVRCEKKQKRIQERGIEVLFWDSRDSFSEELKSQLLETEYLILNLPPSAFKEKSYASGLSLFQQYLASAAKVIHTSSTGVYPNDLKDAKEDFVFRKGNSNRLVEAEKVLQQQLGNRLCILRLAGLIGEDRNPVYYLAKKELNDNPESPVNLIHRKDILRIVLKLIEGNNFGEIFNVCHPDHPTRKEYYSKVAQDFNLPKIQFRESVVNPINKIVNCSKLQVELNYKDFETL